MNYVSFGCWHFTEYDFVFSGNDPGVVKYHAKSTSEDPSPNPGILRVSDSEIRSLDHEVAFYRNPSGPNFSGQFDIDLEILWPGERSESLEVGWYPEVEGRPFSFEDLIVRIEQGDEQKEPWILEEEDR